MRIRWAAAAIAALGSATPLSAQLIPDNAGIADRVDDAYKPIGGRIGSFILYPEATVAANYTDNVLATQTNRHSDEFLTVAPSARLVSQGGDDKINLSTFFQRDFHARMPSEDTSQFGVRSYFRWGPPDLTRLEVTAAALRLVDSREDINNIDEARTPVHRARLNGEVAYTQVFNRLSLTAAVDALRIDYANARDRAGNVIDQEYRDYTSFGGRAEARYTLHSGIMAVAKISGDDLNYDFGPSDPGFNPEFDANRDSRRLRAEGGLGFSIADILYGEVTAGYLTRHFKTQIIPIHNVGGFSFNADLLWNITPITTLRINADRDFLESASRSIAGYRSTGGSVRLDHALLRPLILTVSGNFARIVPIGPAPTRTEYGGTAGFTYLLSRRYSIGGEYHRSGRNSRDEAFAYDANDLMLSFKVRL